MAFDSSADLLLKIGADASDAEANVQRFRGILSKDLGSLKEEFATWAKGVFGDMSNLQGAMLGGTAALLAGMTTLAAASLALGKGLWDLGEMAAKYAEEVEDGTEKTGLSAEAMSGLMFSAKNAGISYGELVGGLVKFESGPARNFGGQ